MIDITFDFESAMIAGQLVRRPSRIAPSQWMAFWEDVVGIGELKIDSEDLRELRAKE